MISRQVPSSALSTIGEIARQAGKGILETYAAEFSVEYKGPEDPVTEADRRANDFICARVRQEFPHAAVVAEESDPAEFADYREHSQVFFVDPLDGTREFVARNDQFVVMIGLLERDRPSLGVIYSPTQDTLWSGECGVGAFRQVGGVEPEAIEMSKVSSASEANLVVSRSRRSARLSEALTAIGVSRVSPLGSAGLKGAEVAQGAADAYLAVGPCGMLWDSCAVEALVTAAGGVFTTARGEEIDYRGKALRLTDGILAANSALHEVLQAELKHALPVR